LNLKINLLTNLIGLAQNLLFNICTRLIEFLSLKWNGFNPLSIDGTTVQLPRIEAISEHFGAWNPRQGNVPWPEFPRCLILLIK